MIALDLSRLLSRAGRGTPTGIDRVELAYAQHLIAAGASTCFAATTVFGGRGLFPCHHPHTFYAPNTRPSRDTGVAPPPHPDAPLVASSDTPRPTAHRRRS